MKFFAYREKMKNCSTAVFTGLDAECRAHAPGRQKLREAKADAGDGWKELAAQVSKTHGSGLKGEHTVAWYMHGTDPDTAGMEHMRVPAPEEVLRRFKENGMWDVHPRIMANGETFENIRAHKAELPYKNWVDALKERAEPYFEEPFAPWVDAGDDMMTKKNYLGPCRVVKVRVQTLAMLYQITGEERYADRAKAEMLNFITYPTYYPEHYLNVAEACYALCLGYDWLYDLFTPEERQQIRDAVKEKCFDTAWGPMSTATEWAGRLNNWNQVCNGGTAIGALAMMEFFPEECSSLVSFALHNIPRSLADIGPEGAYPEGPTYWVYGTAYATYFMSALTSVLGEDYGLSETEGYRETMSYLMYCTSPTGEVASYADTNTMGRGTPQAFWMARLFDEPAYAWYPLQYFPCGGTSESGVYELLWYRPQPVVTPAQAAYPPDMVYDGHESLAFFRKDWEDKDGIYVFFKGGDSQSGHGCLDIGQFLLDRFGVRWACDLKGEDYAVPDYWDKVEGRWRYYRKRAEGHNTLLINPAEGADQDIFAACSIDTFGTAPGAAFAVCDMTEAYACFGAESVRRGCLLFADRTKLLVQDEVRCEKESTLWWSMHTGVEDVSVQGNKAVLRKNGHTLTVTAQTPGAQFMLTPAVPIPTAKNDPCNTPNPGVQVLRLRLTGVKETTLRVVFTFDGDDALPPEMTIDDFADFIRA